MNSDFQNKADDAASLSAKKIFANINGISDEYSVLCERLFAHLRELAFLVSADGGDDMEELRVNMRSLLEPYAAPYVKSGVIPENADAMDVFMRALRKNERVYFCREIYEMLSPRKTGRAALERFFDPPDPLPEGSAGRIAYMRNAYSDAAYSRFSVFVTRAHASYPDSFASVCEDVYNGAAEYCILPLESMSDGRLMSLYTQIDRYDLKVALTADVPLRDGSPGTRFALLKRSVSLADYRGRQDAVGNYFEFCVSVGSGVGMADILDAADDFGLELVRIDSDPLPYGVNDFSFDAVFEISKAELCGFITFLALFVPQYRPVGLYAQIAP